MTHRQPLSRPVGLCATALALAALSAAAWGEGAPRAPSSSASDFASSAKAGSAWPRAPRPGWPRVRGVVESADAAAGEVELKHEAIPNLGMDAMTMVFQLRNPALLRSLKPGDRVDFQADMHGADPAIVWLRRHR
ncbi:MULTISPECIES: copper-binding protein [Ramlibacter]|uniref:Copper-binding protein n=1 Tax=Ramlibacter aquaticus TaxID=2780094 RepID=A0ABR9SEI8_9BURK|nr:MULTISPECIES: copper-binding protein [Ramlibacter]MBE7940778.1 copper-binding protein [Ramlibacter aquaticus]